MKFQTKLKSTSILVDLTPIVDVVFLMLIFFITTSDILPLKSLHIQSATLTEDSAPLTTQLLIVMDAEHVIYLGSKKTIIDMTSIQDKLQEEISTIQLKHPKFEPTIVLSIDKRVDYETFLQLLALVQKSSSKIRLAYQAESSY